MVDLINQICIQMGVAQQGKAISLLKELQFVSEVHFRNEEALLHRIEAEIKLHHLQTVVQIAIAEHERDHQSSLKELYTIVDNARISSAGDDARLCKNLQAWFISHTVGQEVQVRTILQSTSHLAPSNTS